MTGEPEDVIALLSERSGYPAIRVKDDVLWARDHRTAKMIAILDEDRVSSIYDMLIEEFWTIAEDVVATHGYDGCASEGRSSGYLIVDGTDVLLARLPSTEPWTTPTLMLDGELPEKRSLAIEREGFLQLVCQIVALQRSGEQTFVAELQTALQRDAYESHEQEIAALDRQPRTRLGEFRERLTERLRRTAS